MAETLFMCPPEVLDPPGKSFEELRIDDYLHAYRTTGRPPQPFVAHTHPHRAFKPYPEKSILQKLHPPTPLHTPTISVSVPVPPPAIPVPSRPANPAALPDAQNFFTTTFDGEISHCICSIPTFASFSPEELRYYAYLKGHRTPPRSVQLAPFVPSTPLTNSTTIMFNRPGTDTPASSDIMMSVSAKPEFAGHSVEELRLAYMQTGKELTSSEVFALSPPPSRPTLFASTGGGGGAFSRPPTVRQF
ncbi:hypothetical protein Hypma_012320 [Hypsizygus marmoreus]|uniref:Uncharacterized protein n=1 Tax=Hypsizygus marmoreus TaxID=39966 RepID=A0A369JLP9_HYPMA|nr:hypothetical protein Hypma_012320 [Hypsizygus marmoreus]